MINNDLYIAGEDKKKIVIYIAGKYTANTKEEIMKNIAKADYFARELLSMGVVPICPHTMCGGWEEDSRFEWEDFMEMDLEIISRVDGVFFLDNWKDSKGSIKERDFAKKLNKPIFDSLEDLEALLDLMDKESTSQDFDFSQPRKNLQTLLPFNCTEEELDNILKMYFGFTALDLMISANISRDKKGMGFILDFLKNEMGE